MHYRLFLVCATLGVSSPLLQAADLNAGKAKAAEVCAACHGAEGNSSNPTWPNLAGQHASYIAKQLADFKPANQGVANRPNPIMAGIVAGLSDADTQNLAAYFASLPRTHGLAKAESIALGEKVYRAGNKDTGVPACMACHGPTGAGNPPANFPAVSGQHATYTAATLSDFRAGRRTNDTNKMMQSITQRMTDPEIQAVADYMAGLH
jgi:cytochrome c553